MWCIPPKASAEFVWHTEDVLNVYHRPYDPRRPVVDLDQTSERLIGEAREPLPPAFRLPTTGPCPLPGARGYSRATGAGAFAHRTPRGPSP